MRRRALFLVVSVAVALPGAASAAEGGAGSPARARKRGSFSTPSPAAERRKIVERKVKAVKLKTRKGSTAAARAKKEFAGKQRPDIKRFEDPMDRNRALIEAKRKQIEDRRQQLLARLKRIYDRVLGQGGNPRREAMLLHRMAELRWESARYAYFQARFQYEKEMEAFLDNKRKDKPAEPKPDYRKAMEVYRKILRDHPKYRRIDEVIYFLGDGLRLIGKDGDAAPYFQKLVKNHPNSKFVPDAQLGLAEYFFKSDLLFAARDAYKRIIQRFPNSRVYNYALYKLAWTYYNLGGMDPKSFRLCIDTFKKVISTIDAAGKDLEKQKIEFRAKALKDLVIAFSAVPTGLQEARDYFLKRGGMPLAKKMLDRLARFFLAHDKDEEAIAVYRWFMSVEPNGERLPEWSETILESLKKIGKKARIEKEMLAIVERFGPKGSWTQANAGKPKLIQKARSMAENSLEYLASNYHQEAQRLREDALYEKAAKYYKLFVDTFPESKKAYRARFYLAEITLLKLKNPEKAAQFYTDVVKAGPGEFLADAAYGRITCYYQLMKADRHRTKVGGSFKYVKMNGKKKGKGAGKVAKPTFVKRAIPKWERKYVSASDDYVRLVQKPEDAVPVMYNAAEIFFFNNHYAEAVKRYAYIVDKHPQSKYALYAANNILESYNRLRDWKQIELWAKRLRDNPKFKARPRRELERFISLAIFNQANQLRDSKEHDRAAAELLRLQREIPKSSLSAEALFSAASLYSEGKKQDIAIKTFKRLLEVYPRSPKAARATFLVGAIHEGLADFEQAAKYFEKRAEFKDKKSKEARDALYNAGLLREALGQHDRALKLYGRFLKRFRKHPDAAELYFRIARLHEHAKAWREALRAYDRYLRRYRKKFRTVRAYLRGALMEQRLGRARRAMRRLRTTVRVGKKFLTKVGKKELPLVQRWVAHARLLEGKDLFKKYKGLKFSLPQRKMVRQIKRKGVMLKKVTDIFEDVLTFKSAERSACALWMIGQTYQDFSQSLLDAPIPRGLNADETQVYKIKLQEKALPVEEKAFEAYGRGLKLAAQNNVFNRCVQQAGSALAKAKPEEYPAVIERQVKVKHVATALAPAPLDLGSASAPRAKSAGAAATGGVSHAAP